VVVYVKTKTRTQKNVVLANYTPKDIKNVTNQILRSYIIMNTGQKIFKKLFKDEKTELNAESVKLGMVEDLQKLKESAEKFIKEIRDGIKENDAQWNKSFELEKQYLAEEKKAQIGSEKLLAKSKNADKFKARMDKLYDKVEKAADSLGVPVKGVKGFAEFDKVYDDLFRVEDEVRSM